MEKTLIGVLASHDSLERNLALATVFREAWEKLTLRETLTDFCFVFTGGTYSRLIKGEQVSGMEKEVLHNLELRIACLESKRVCRKKVKKKVPYKLEKNIVSFLHTECGIIQLPRTQEGGVIKLSSLVTQRKVSILWPFFSPRTAHLLYPENIALLRLADTWHVKKLMNLGSVKDWLRGEAKRDKNLNVQEIPFNLKFPQSEVSVRVNTATQSAPGGSWSVSRRANPPKDFLQAKEERDLDGALGNAVIALISHDEMKDRMIDFVVDYEKELGKFKSILATGATGKLVKEAAPTLEKKVNLRHSGPNGGDIEIATEILLGGCDVVIFFVDTLHPHAHIEDIRVLFAACMIQEQVSILSNEMQARDWMDRMIRGR
ncbi:methylglyoxal synthase [candidate division WOR-3 bacterium]|nr:methylglyoxal synthase [candidate division WOR-3 bacterium]